MNLRTKYDVDRGEHENILTVPGLLVAVRHVLTIVPSGLLWCGVPCSLWIFISANFHKRTKGSIEGDLNRQGVKKANAIVCRVILLCLLSMSISVEWCIEQPHSSVMPAYPRMASLLQLLFKIKQLQFSRFSMGLFGALTVKSSKLWGTASEPRKN